MNEPELKDNLCVVKFRCTELFGTKNCVHHKNKKYCKFASISENRVNCTNSIAQVQAISRYLKHIGLELSSDGFNAGIYRDIKDEVNRAKTLHENKDYTPVDWLAVLMEEVGEIGREINNLKESGEPLNRNYRTELIQVAAVAIRALQDYDRSGL